MPVIEEFSNKLYCDATGGAVTKAVAGKDILLCIFNSTGEKLLAIAGQQSVTINREKEIIEVNSKTIDGGWKSKVPGIKDWNIEVEGMYSDEESHKALSDAFEKDEFICCKVINNKAKAPMFGGLALVKELNLEAPFDDATTFEITLEGCGALKDLSKESAPAMPGEKGLEA